MQHKTLSMKRIVLCLFLLKTYLVALQVQRGHKDEIFNLSKEQCDDIVDSKYEKRDDTCTCSKKDKHTVTSSLSSRLYGCRDLDIKGGTINIFLLDFFRVTLRSLKLHAF